MNQSTKASDLTKPVAAGIGADHNRGFCELLAAPASDRTLVVDGMLVEDQG